MEVRRYDSRGKFVSAFGTRGAAPEEYSSITALAVNPEGDVLVGDPRLGRLTIIGHDGSIETASWSVTNPLRRALHARGIGYILLSGPSPFPGEDVSHPMFSIVGEDLAVSAVFGDYNELGLVPDRFSVHSLEINPGYFDYDSQGRILHVPSLYSGRIFRFALIDGKWDLHDVIMGGVSGPAYILEDPRHPPAGATVTHATFGNSAGFIRSQSAGLHVMPDSSIWHFSISVHEDQRQMIVEQFTAGGELTAIRSVGLHIPEYSGPAPVEFQVSDGERFYVIDRTDSYPKVRVVTLH
jgi:hypothetical protein